MRTTIMLFICLSIALGESGKPPLRWERSRAASLVYTQLLAFASSTKLAISEAGPSGDGTNSEILLLDAETGKVLTRIASGGPVLHPLRARRLWYPSRTVDF